MVSETTPQLLSRDEFREQVRAREQNLCAVKVCSAIGVDAHHIIERRLFPDGGYYLDNGAYLCPRHHLLAESTELSAQEIRDWVGISRIILPPHLYRDTVYDKWGNVILPNGRRLKGELFEDDSVQKVLAPVLHLFDERVKYPRTWHLPWSHPSKDDRVLSYDTLESWIGVPMVITEKMDGENTTLYRGQAMHARSIDYTSHPSRDWVRSFHAQIAYDIPEGYRICGENLAARHSIAYDNLESFFLGFSMWKGDYCLPWDDTLEWFQLLGITPVPEVTRIVLDDFTEDTRMSDFVGPIDESQCEGFVMRPLDGFRMAEFHKKVGKYVRRNHVQTHGHWMRSAIVPNRTRFGTTAT